MKTGRFNGSSVLDDPENRDDLQSRREIASYVILPLVVVFGFVLFFAVKIAEMSNLWFGFGFFLSIFGAFLLQGLRKIPADPPHKGVLTVFGKRCYVVKNEGWHFFPLYPWWHGVILVNVTKVNQDLSEQLVRTPDLAELKVPVSLTWKPMIKTNEKGKGGLIEFLNSGGEKGVKTILEGIVRERLREWAISSSEGPQTWQEAIAAKEEATAILLQAICGDELKQIPSDIPTSILLKALGSFHKKPNKIEAEIWGKEWELVKEKVNSLPDADRKKLMTALEERLKQIARARQGNGDFKLPQLGIVINRLNIGEIKPVGELAKAAELEVKEACEREAETTELNHVRQRLIELMAQPPNGPGFKAEQALEVIQTERGKVAKTVAETKLNVSAETMAAIERIIQGLISQKGG